MISNDIKEIIVTTSWNDGNKLDLRLIGLLDKYSLNGTFYLSQKGQPQSLTNQDIREINQIRKRDKSHYYFMIFQKFGNRVKLRNKEKIYLIKNAIVLIIAIKSRIFL